MSMTLHARRLSVPMRPWHAPSRGLPELCGLHSRMLHGTLDPMSLSPQLQHQLREGQCLGS